jgi:hypothetical protein
MRKPVALLMSVIVLVSSIVLTNFTTSVFASKGKAKVYILCLNGVGGSWVEDPSRVKEGAVLALSPTESTEIPLVHPKNGRTPPFYDIKYEIVTSWNMYRNLIENYAEIIILNTHGEILPIPYDYRNNETGWVGNIARAMLYRRVSWVHIGGYPFFQVWYEGDTVFHEWPSGGIFGFRNLTSYINKPNVDCWPPAPESEKVALNIGTRQDFRRDYTHLDEAFYIELGRPLKAADFDEYVLKTIHGVGDYYTSAVIAFAKPGQRFDVPMEHGFGAYVHIGGGQTFNSRNPPEPTDKDKWRGYVGAAAAVSVEMQSFPGNGLKTCTLGSSPDSEMSIYARPYVTSYTFDDQLRLWKVRMSFFAYGLLKTKYPDNFRIGYVKFVLSDLPADCKVQLQPDLSRNGRNSGLALQGMRTSDSTPIVGSVLYGLSLTSLVIPELVLLTVPLGGLKLCSDWYSFGVNQQDPTEGVSSPCERIWFTYFPSIEETNLGDGYLYEEFESIVTAEVTINVTNRPQWTTVPLRWYMELGTNVPALYPYAGAGISLVVYNDYVGFAPFKATVFFEDFEDDLAGWTTCDLNSYAGQDYWGIFTPKTGLCTDNSHAAWCAQIGDSSIESKPNEEILEYDKGMNACLRRQVDLRPYQAAELSYNVETIIKLGDLLVVEGYDAYNKLWYELKRYSSAGENYYNEYSIPLLRGTQQIGFRFVSNDDDNVWIGVLVDNVEIRAVIPNDAGKNVDAGDLFGLATSIEVSDAITNYAGYLSDDDWYQFNVAQWQRIVVTLRYPSEAVFTVALYNPNGDLRGLEPSSSISYTADGGGWWRIKVTNTFGFGQYNFDITVFTMPPGGPGCPILYVYNGSEYACEGLLDIHNPDCVDIVRNHTIISSPVPVNGLLRMSLVEHPQTDSHIDQVKLYAVLENNMEIRLPLVWAWHSDDGFVLSQLLLSDDWRTETLGADHNNGTSQFIDLRFVALPSCIHVKAYIFQIEGYNPNLKR